MRTLALAALAASLVACHSPTEPGSPLSSGSSSWSALYAAGPVLVWRPPRDGWSTIPDDASLNALVYSVAVRGEEGQMVSVEYEVACSGNGTGQPAEFDAEIGSAVGRDTNPATVSLVIVQAGTDFAYQEARFYGVARQRLACGRGRVQAVLAPENWNGVRGVVDGRLFAETTRAIGGVGVTFGGQNYAGHGVRVAAGGGQAKVRLVAWEVK